MHSYVNIDQPVYEWPAPLLPVYAPDSACQYRRQSPVIDSRPHPKRALPGLFRPLFP